MHCLMKTPKIGSRDDDYSKIICILFKMPKIKIRMEYTMSLFVKNYKGVLVVLKRTLSERN
jgi:hypothetical protein